jgi:hypothetical protein
MPQALPALTIPASPGELTPEWLTAALRSHGAIKDASIVEFSTEILGVGEGFIGTIARLGLTLDKPEPDAPQSVIAKFPTQTEQNKALGEQTGTYENEIRFYNELAHRVPMRTPRFYYSDMDPNPMEGRQEQILLFLDRWPSWLIRVMLPVFQWLIGLGARRYVLLIEDLAPRRVGDQVAGCDAREAEAILRTLAQMHAAFWNRVDEPELSWVPRMHWMRHWFQVVYRQNWSGFVERWGGRLPRTAEAAGWLEPNGVKLIEALAALPPTLLHGDYRLDNMCLFEGDSGELCNVTFDWQSPSRGPGVIDAVYFISGNLQPEVAAEHADGLLRSYHDALVAGGVRDYSFEQLRVDSDLAKLWIAWRFIMGIEMLDLANERGEALIDSWLIRLEQLLPDRYPALLS